MRHPVGLVALTALCFVALHPAFGQLPWAKSTSAPTIDVFFSPHGGCTDAVVKELGKARSTVLVQAYSFTSREIAKALVDAHKRGVKVEVIVDKSELKEGHAEADFILQAGIPVKVDALHAIAHNKIAIIDSKVVVTGSFNFTNQAENHNAENLLVITDKALAEKYTANWQTHAGHSRIYEAKEQGYSETHRLERSADPAPATESGGYMASKNSGVFHKAGCKGAAKISEKNIVRYATRDEAIRAGKKPCHECNP
jgi:phosphatidylserine/phosphatidylglycerophosphate/cardiolipin synthase-like enzyme